MSVVEDRTGELSEDERQAFVEEATAFLEANAERRPAKSDTFVWGEGPEVSLMGGKDDADEDARLVEARAWRAKVFDAGFGWLGGPVEYGGAGRRPGPHPLFPRLGGAVGVAPPRGGGGG